MFLCGFLGVQFGFRFVCLFLFWVFFFVLVLGCCWFWFLKKKFWYPGEKDHLSSLDFPTF